MKQTIYIFKIIITIDEPCLVVFEDKCNFSPDFIAFFFFNVATGAHHQSGQDKPALELKYVCNVP